MANIIKQNDVTVIELDAQYSGLADPTELTSLLLSAADTAEPPMIVLDLSKTEYFDSQFVEVMIRVWKRIRQRDGDMSLSGLSPFCGDVIRILKLDSIWGIHKTRDEAVAALASEL